MKQQLTPTMLQGPSRLLWLIPFGLLLSLLSLCHHSKPGRHWVEYQVKQEVLQQSLHFTGTIQALSEQSISTALEGNIEEIKLHFGQAVKKDALIMVIHSQSLQREFNDSLSQYLKAKDSYAISEAKFAGTEDLWQSGLVAKNNYISEKSSFNAAKLSLIEARRKLTELLEKTGDKQWKKFSDLNLNDFERVKATLNQSHQRIYIRANKDGVLLYPPKGSSENDNPISVGSAVKAGQVLALIGDLSGIKIDISIPEVDIQRVKAGLPVEIQPLAFPEIQIQGVLSQVNAQANASSQANLPAFTAVVEAQNISAKDRSYLKIGMSAAVRLALSRNKQILIPIQAIHERNKQSWVKRIDRQGKAAWQKVETGSVQADKVLIVSGLQEGDRLRYEVAE